MAAGRFAAAVYCTLLIAAVRCSSEAAAAAPRLPWVTISPLKGTLDASPTTQISLLGVPAADISHVSVRGSRSGGHSGTLAPYATGTGVSFLPARAFTPGEQVTVTAVERAEGREQQVGTTFTVGSLYKVPIVAAAPAPAATPGSELSFLSLPQLHPPTVTVTTPAADPGLGDIFLTPKDGASQPGPMIVDPTGQTRLVLRRSRRGCRRPTCASSSTSARRC